MVVAVRAARFEPVPVGNGLTGRVVASVADLVRAGLTDPPDLAAWASPSWWRFVEADPDHQLAFLVIERSGLPVAVAPVLWIGGPGELVFYNSPLLIGDFPAMGAANQLEPAEAERVAGAAEVVEAARQGLYPSLTVGVFGSHLGLRPFAGDAGLPLAVVVPALAELATRVAGAWGCASHALLYLGPAEEAAASSHPSQRRQRFLMGAEAVLDVPAGDFDDYLHALPSGRPNRIRREMRQYAEAGARTEVAVGPGALTDEYLPLRSALRAKYGHRADLEWARTEFDTLRRTVGDELHVFSARMGERVIGYLMALRRGNALFTRSAGFDYEASAGSYCYFNLVYYDVIAWAQRNGVHRIHYGLGTLAAKHHRGCHLLPRWGHLYLPDDAPAEVGEVLGLQHASQARLLQRFGTSGV